MYKGEYIALVNGKVVASGTDAKIVLDKAKSRNRGKEIILRKIPGEETLILKVSWK